MRFEATVPCPRCDGEIRVEAEYEEGEPAQTSGPSDSWYPGHPPGVWITGENGRSGCECDLSDADWTRIGEDNYERLIEVAEEESEAREDAYYDRKMEAQRDEDTLGKY